MAEARLATRAGAPFACGIVNVKHGGCSEDCAFCAQSAYYRGTGAEAIDADPDDDELLHRAEAMHGAGLSYMGLAATGACPTARELGRYCAFARRLCARVDIRLCASLGILDAESATRLKDAGFTNYHHNLETTRSFFPRICTTHTYEERLATVRHARAAGLRVCSGGLFGLDEGWAERDEPASTLADLGVDSLPVNFLTPVPGTPLGGCRPLSVADALLIIARLRPALPEADIVACGGRPTVLGEFDRLVFSAGANGLMTGDYLTTPGRAATRDFELFSALGLAPTRR